MPSPLFFQSFTKTLLPKSRRWMVRCLPLLLILALTGCYIPDNFFCEIRLGNTGDFGLTYRGDLIWGPLLRQIRSGELAPEAIPAKIEEIRQDLERDRIKPATSDQAASKNGFSSIMALSEGRFRVEYYREGHLNAESLVTFLRRNSVIFSLKSNPDGTIIVSGTSLKSGDAQSLNAMGLTPHGEVRIVTAAKVLKHNAQQVRPFGPYLVYMWKVQGVLEQPPYLVMQRSGS